jgi:hypothetical protein
MTWFSGRANIKADGRRHHPLDHSVVKLDGKSQLARREIYGLA